MKVYCSFCADLPEAYLENENEMYPVCDLHATMFQSDPKKFAKKYLPKGVDFHLAALPL